MGHMRSILPQRGGISPVDNNTVALFNYDKGVSDTLKGIKPIGEKVCIEFNDTHVDVGSDNTMALTTAISVEAWIYPTAYTNHGTILTRNASYYFQLHTTGKINAYQYGTSPAGYHESIETVPLNKWTHVAYTYDGSHLVFYINGAESGKIAKTGEISAVGEYPVQIGEEGGIRKFQGKISKVKLWARALSSEEVKKSMNGIDINRHDIVGDWKLNEGEGSLIYDYSGCGNDGAVDNGKWVEGRAVYSLVDKGFPGGMITAQEETENLIDPYSPPLQSGYDATAEESTENVYVGQMSWKMVNTQPADLTYRGWVFDMIEGNTYTGSFYVYDPENLIYQVLLYDGTGNEFANSTHEVVDLGGGYKRHIATGVAERSGTTSHGFIFYWEGGSNTIWISGAQVEEKSYATDFTVGRRSGRESYGGGLLMEEETLNYYSNPSIFEGWSTVENQSNSLSYEVYGTNKEGNTIVKVTKIIGDMASHASFRTCTIPGMKIDGTTQYTLSFKVKMLSGGSVQDRITAHSNGTSTNIQSYKEIGDGWYLCERTITGHSSCQGVGFIGSDPFECLVTEPQLEEKQYATSFVDGNRSIAVVQYPISLTPPFTFSCWVKSLNSASDYLMDTRISDVEGHLIYSGGSDGRLTWLTRLGDNSNWDGITSTSYVFDNNWHYIAISMDTDLRKKMYVDGVLENEKATPSIKSYGGYTYIGCRYSKSNSLNGIVDGIRIDDIVRTGDEIKSWYYQGRNGW